MQIWSKLTFQHKYAQQLFIFCENVFRLLEVRIRKAKV